MELKLDPGFWREYLSQIDSILRVNMTSILISSQFDSNILLYSESRVEFQFHQLLNFLGQNDSIFTFSAPRGNLLYNSAMLSVDNLG